MLFSAWGTVLYAKSSMGDGPISIETQPAQPFTASLSAKREAAIASSGPDARPRPKAPRAGMQRRVRGPRAEDGKRNGSGSPCRQIKKTALVRGLISVIDQSELGMAAATAATSPPKEMV
jgi:hypothetical protein